MYFAHRDEWHKLFFFLNLLEKAYYDDNDNDKLYNL